MPISLPLLTHTHSQKVRERERVSISIHTINARYNEKEGKEEGAIIISTYAGCCLPAAARLLALSLSSSPPSSCYILAFMQEAMSGKLFKPVLNYTLDWPFCTRRTTYHHYCHLCTCLCAPFENPTLCHATPVPHYLFFLLLSWTDFDSKKSRGYIYSLIIFYIFIT